MRPSSLLRELDTEGVVACYGALFAMAAVDGVMHPAELALIDQSLESEGITPEVRERIESFREHPPLLRHCLHVLAHSSKTARLGVLVQLIAIAMADNVLAVDEEHALRRASSALGISQEQYTKISAKLQEERERQAEANRANPDSDMDVTDDAVFDLAPPVPGQQREVALDQIIENLVRKKRASRLQTLVTELSDDD